MTDEDAIDPPPNLLLLAHLRRIALDEILKSLPPDQSQPAASAAVQRLARYLDEGPVSIIARNASIEQFRAAIDQVIDEIQSQAARPI